jgi:hypothetical protein
MEIEFIKVVNGVIGFFFVWMSTVVNDLMMKSDGGSIREVGDRWLGVRTNKSNER